MNVFVAIHLIPLFGIAASAPSSLDVIQESNSEDMDYDDSHSSVGIYSEYKSQCTRGCQILVGNTLEADERCQDDVIYVPMPAGDPVSLAREGTVCRPGNASELHVCRVGFWIKKQSAPKFTLNCPQDIIDTVANGELGKHVFWETPSISDDSSVTIVGRPPSGSFFELGDTVVTLEAKKQNTNTAKCSFTVTITVIDSPTAPYFNRGIAHHV